MTHFGAKMTVFFTDFGRFPPYFRAFSDSSSGLRTLPAAGITFLSVSAFFSPPSPPTTRTLPIPNAFKMRCELNFAIPRAHLQGKFGQSCRKARCL